MKATAKRRPNKPTKRVAIVMEKEQRDLHNGPSLMDFMPERPEPEAFVARAGSPRADDTGSVPLEADLIEAMQTVYDPEIPVNIYDLGLVYGLEAADNGNVEIKMTLTAPRKAPRSVRRAFTACRRGSEKHRCI